MDVMWAPFPRSDPLSWGAQLEVKTPVPQGESRIAEYPSRVLFVAFGNKASTFHNLALPTSLGVASSVNPSL